MKWLAEKGEGDRSERDMLEKGEGRGECSGELGGNTYMKKRERADRLDHFTGELRVINCFQRQQDKETYAWVKFKDEKHYQAEEIAIRRGDLKKGGTLGGSRGYFGWKKTILV